MDTATLGGNEVPVAGYMQVKRLFPFSGALVTTDTVLNTLHMSSLGSHCSIT